MTDQTIRSGLCNAAEPNGVHRCELFKRHRGDHVALAGDGSRHEWPRPTTSHKQRVDAGIETLTAAEVVKLLQRHHAATPGLNGVKPWVTIPELRIGTGFIRYNIGAKGRTSMEMRKAHDPHHDPADNPEARIDLFAMDTRPSKSFRRIAYEVKVSIADFRSEVNNPDKRAAAMAVTNQFTFAVPEGLVIAPADVPDDCGLVVVKADGRLSRSKPAPWRDVGDPPVSFLASIARRIDR